MKDREVLRADANRYLIVDDAVEDSCGDRQEDHLQAFHCIALDSIPWR